MYAANLDRFAKSTTLMPSRDATNTAISLAARTVRTSLSQRLFSFFISPALKFPWYASPILILSLLLSLAYTSKERFILMLMNAPFAPSLSFSPFLFQSACLLGGWYFEVEGHRCVYHWRRHGPQNGQAEADSAYHRCYVRYTYSEVVSHGKLRFY